MKVNRPGETNIETEISSSENKFFILHNSIGFEPGANDAFTAVKRFILQRSQEHLETKDRLHAIWSVTLIRNVVSSSSLEIRFCTQTPTVGGRIFEQGDEKLLQLAYEQQSKNPL